MKKIQFNEVKSYEDIEKAIQDALEYDEVVENEEAARQWFKDAGIEGEVISRDIANYRLPVWNDEMDGEEWFEVRVYEHYVEPGSSDYVYSYIIK